MKLFLNIREALRALRANKLRSVLTMLGIVFGVAAVIVMVAIGAGTREQIRAEIERLGTNTLMISPSSSRTAGASTGSGRRPSLTDLDAMAIAIEVQDVLAAAPIVRGRVNMVFGNRNWSSSVQGTTDAFLAARDWGLSDGRNFDQDEIAFGGTVAIIGQTVARQLFGDTDPIDRMIRVNHLSVQVVGVLEPKGQSMDGGDFDDILLMPLVTARNSLLGRVAGRAQSVNTIIVRVAEGISMEWVAQDIAPLLRQRHGLLDDEEDSFRIRDMADYLRMQEAANSAMTTLLGAVASISLLVGGIGIMNIMLVSVSERTREIGIRAAVGANPRDLLLQFLVEAVVLSFLGALIGALVGMAGILMSEQIFEMQTAFSVEAFVISAGFAAVIGVVFGLYPAWKAARMQPVDALRHA